MNDESQTQIISKSGKVIMSQSTIWGVSIRGWIVMVVILTVCAMSLGGIEVIEPLYTIAISAVSFYFGQNAQQAKDKKKDEVNGI